MSEENVETVRRHNEAWNRRDLTAWLGSFGSGAEVDWSRSRGPLKGVYRGYGELESFWDAFHSIFEDVQVEFARLHGGGLRSRGPEHLPHPGAPGHRGGREKQLRVHGREWADHPPPDVPRASRGPRSRRRAVGVANHQPVATSSSVVTGAGTASVTHHSCWERSFGSTHSAGAAPVISRRVLFACVVVSSKERSRARITPAPFCRHSMEKVLTMTSRFVPLPSRSRFDLLDHLL